MKSLLAIFILFACISPLHPQVPDSSKYRVLDCSEFKSGYNVAKKPILIDVREYKDFRKSRIKGAVNIPRSGGYENAAESLDKNCSLFIYCYAGVNSKRAAVYFFDKGFREIYSLKGGMMRWRGERMAVDRKKLKKIA